MPKVRVGIIGIGNCCSRSPAPISAVLPSRNVIPRMVTLAFAPPDAITSKTRSSLPPSRMVWPIPAPMIVIEASSDES